jgi:hypothetical protein
MAATQDLNDLKQSVDVDVEHLEDDNNGSESGDVTSQEGRRLIRRIDLRLLPILCVIYAMVSPHLRQFFAILSSGCRHMSTESI